MTSVKKQRRDENATQKIRISGECLREAIRQNAEVSGALVDTLPPPDDDEKEVCREKEVG
jgi:hypothetical protein